MKLKRVHPKTNGYLIYPPGQFPYNIDYVYKCLSYSPIGLWPLVSNFKDYSGFAHHGTDPRDAVTFTSGGGVDGYNAAYFNETAYVDVYSDSLKTLFSGDEFVIAGWIKPSSNAIIDGNYHDAPIFYSDVSDNYIFLRTRLTTLSVARTANATVKTWDPISGTLSSTWIHFALRMTYAGDLLRCYINGTADTDVTGNASWQGTLESNGALFGASSGTDQIKTHFWDGWMQYMGIYPLLSEFAISALATIA